MPNTNVALPGTCPQNRCTTVAVLGTSGSGIKERQGDQPAIMCVTDVEVLSDGALKVNVRWSIESVQREWRYVGMNRNGEFTNTYLVDNRGKRYEARELSGAARDSVHLQPNRPWAMGWYVFPPPQPGATSFALRDDEQQVDIAGIEIK